MKKRILIVDDDGDHAESLADILELQGHEVELADSGETALLRFAETDFDLIFMDVKLPGMNGVETFLSFRRMREKAHVFMMTGYSVEQLVAEALDKGALGVLYKPFSPADLLAAVAKSDLMTKEPPQMCGRIFLADMDALLIDQVSPILTEAGYKVEVVEGDIGQMAAERLEDVDCIIVNREKSLLRGMELCIDIRNQLGDMPKMLVVGSEGDEQFTQSTLLTQGILQKPLDAENLLRGIAHLLHPEVGETNAGNMTAAPRDCEPQARRPEAATGVPT